MRPPKIVLPPRPDQKSVGSIANPAALGETAAVLPTAEKETEQAEATTARPPWRARAARVFFVVVLLAHAVLIVRAYHDPHKFFGYQPFNESDTWQADLFRVTTDGERMPIVNGRWLDYSWDDLVGVPRLTRPGRLRHANSGAAATIDFLDEALDWVADHTPDDTETLYLEAEVTWFRNTRGPHHTVVRSEDREEAR